MERAARALPFCSLNQLPSSNIDRDRAICCNPVHWLCRTCTRKWLAYTPVIFAGFIAQPISSQKAQNVHRWKQQRKHFHFALEPTSYLNGWLAYKPVIFARFTAQPISIGKAQEVHRWKEQRKHSKFALWTNFLAQILTEIELFEWMTGIYASNFFAIHCTANIHW